MLNFLGLRREKGGFVGRWNGRKIAGIDLQIKLFFDTWNWMPLHSEFSSSIRWLCFWASLEWVYGRRIEEKQGKKP
jgi:hypothetical protein